MHAYVHVHVHVCNNETHIVLNKVIISNYKQGKNIKTITKISC